MKYLVITVAIVLSVVNITTFILYGVDKYKAVNGLWRIPEKVLLLFSLFGGGIGGFIGMLVFHHKTSKWYFTAINMLGIAWQIWLIVFLLIKLWS